MTTVAEGCSGGSHTICAAPRDDIIDWAVNTILILFILWKTFGLRAACSHRAHVKIVKQKSIAIFESRSSPTLFVRIVTKLLNVCGANPFVHTILRVHPEWWQAVAKCTIVHGQRLRNTNTPNTKTKNHSPLALLSANIKFASIFGRNKRQKTPSKNVCKWVFKCVGLLIRIQCKQRSESSEKTRFCFSIEAKRQAQASGTGTHTNAEWKNVAELFFARWIQPHIILISARHALSCLVLSSVGWRAANFMTMRTANANTLQLWKYRFMG